MPSGNQLSPGRVERRGNVGRTQDAPHLSDGRAHHFGDLDLENAKVTDKEVKLAEMLINELSEKGFDPLKYKDEYRERLLERIRAKSHGKPIVAEEREEEKGGEVIDIMEALRRSLDKGRAPARPRRAARKAPAKRRTATAHKKRKAS